MPAAAESLRDADLDGPSPDASKGKGQSSPERAAVIGLLAGLALASLAFAASGVRSLVRTESRLPRPNVYARYVEDDQRDGSRLDRTHFDQIQTGMTLGEVERLLGGKAGLFDNVARLGRSVPLCRFEPLKGSLRDVLDWRGARCVIHVRFDDERRVVDREYCPVTYFRTRWDGTYLPISVSDGA